MRNPALNLPSTATLCNTADGLNPSFHLQVAQLPLSLPQGIWQHICVSWTLRDGVWKAYQGGKLRGRGEGLSAWHPIKSGGVLVLGQEQVSKTWKILNTPSKVHLHSCTFGGAKLVTGAVPSTEHLCTLLTPKLFIVVA